MDIDLIFKIAAVGIIVSILNQVLVRSGREEQATMTTLAGLVVVLLIVVQKVAQLFDLVKNLFGTAKPILMIPACFLGGGAFCLFCDLIARTAFAPTELSISTVTAILGAPIVIYVMIRRRKGADGQ